MKIVPVTTSSAGSFRLSDKPPLPLIDPGVQVVVVADLQTPVPLLFTRVRLGPTPGLLSVGPHGISTPDDAGVWRIDEIFIDDEPIKYHGDEAIRGVGKKVTTKATNIGEAPSHFYATYETEDVH